MALIRKQFLLIITRNQQYIHYIHYFYLNLRIYNQYILAEFAFKLCHNGLGTVKCAVE